MFARRSSCAVAALLVLACAASVPAQAPDARITEGATNNEAEFIGKAAIDYPMLQVGIQNLALEPIVLSSITFTAVGNGDDLVGIATGGVRLVRDANGDGEASTDLVAEPILGTGSYSMDNGTITFGSFAPIEIAAGSTLNVLLVYQMSGLSSDGETFGAVVASDADIDLTIVSTSTPVTFQPAAFPVEAVTKTVGPGALTVSVLSDSVNSKIPPYFVAGLPRSEAVRLQLSNSKDERILVRSIALTSQGTLDDALISQVDGLEYVPLTSSSSDLTRTAEALAVTTVTENDGVSVLEFDPPIEFARGQTRYAAVAWSTKFVESEYFKSARFTVQPGGVAAEGLDSLTAVLQVLGEGAAGPNRSYHGHGNLLALDSDPGTGTYAPGATHRVMWGFSIENDDFEPVVLTSVTIRASGNINEAAELLNFRLWRDSVNNGRVDTEETGATSFDQLLAGPLEFSNDNGTVTFPISYSLAKGAKLSLLLAADIGEDATENATMRFQIESATSINGMGSESTARIVTRSTLPFQSSIRSIKTPVAVQPVYPMSELDTTDDRWERKAMPRTGNNIVAWNFGADLPEIENLYFRSAKIQVTGSVDDSVYLESARLYFDKNSNGKFDSGTDVLVSQADAFSGDNPLLTFGVVDDGNGLELTRNGLRSFLLVLDLKDAPASVLNKTIHFSLPDDQSFVLRGKSTGLDGRFTPVPFQTADKQILPPSATLAIGADLPPAQTVLVCMNNGSVEIVQFTLKAGASEGFEWRQLDVEGSSSLGNSGLADHVHNVFLFMDGNADGDLLSISDRLMTTGPHTFVGDLLTLPVWSELPLLIGAYPEGDRDKIQLPFDESSTFVISYSLQSDTRLPTDGSVTFTGQMPGGSLKLVGKDSGDPVNLIGDVDILGRTASIAQGDVTVTNVSSSIQNYTRAVPPGARNVESIWLHIQTSPIEDVGLDRLVFHITQSNPATPLENILDGPTAATLHLGRNRGLGALAQGQIDFAAGTITVRPEDFVFGPNVFYSYFTQPPDSMVLLLDVKSTAPQGESITVSLEGLDDIAFIGNCSLTPAPLYETTLGDEPPLVGRPLVFGASTLTIDLTKRTEDFPTVAFPGRATNYAAVRAKMSADTTIEPIILTGLDVAAIGTADDVGALATTNSIQLRINNQLLGSAIFPANDGMVSFNGFETLIEKDEKFEIFLNPGDPSINWTNIGDTMTFSVPAGGIRARGQISEVPISKFAIKDEIPTSDVDPLPFTPPTVRIGAGRLYTKVEQTTTFATSHPASRTDVVVMSFVVETDRAENAFLEEVNVTALGTIDEVANLAGATIRLYENKSSFTAFNGSDPQIGVGTFSADNGVARIRVTPRRAIAAARLMHFFLVVDLNGTAADFSTLQFALSGPSAIQVRGDLSGELLTPWYGTDSGTVASGSGINGPVHTIGRATLDFDLLTNAGTNTATNPKYVLPGATSIPVLSFTAKALSIEDMQATSFTLQTRGSANDSTAITAARLYVDVNKDGAVQGSDVLLATSTPPADDAPITFLFTTPQNILRSQTVYWLVAYDLSTTIPVGASFQAHVANLPPRTLIPINGVVGGFGLLSSAPIGVERTESGTKPFEGPYLQFSSGRVELRKGSKTPAARDLLTAAQNVPLFQFNAWEEFNLEPVSLERISLVAASTNSLDFAAAFAGATFTLYRESTTSTNGVVDGADVAIGTGTFNTTNNRLEFDLTASPSIISRGGTNVYLVTGSFAAPASVQGKSFTLSVTAPDLFMGTGVTSSLPTIFAFSSSAFSSNVFTFQPSRVTVTRDSHSPDSGDGIAPDGIDQTLIVIDMKPSNAASVTLERLVVDATGSMNEPVDFVPGSIRLVRDNGSTLYALDSGDTVISASGYTTDNGRIVFESIDPPVTLGANATTQFIIVGTLSGTSPEGRTMALRIPSEAGSIQFATIPDGYASSLYQTTLPITSGPTPLVHRRMSFNTTPPALADRDIRANTTNAVAWRCTIAATKAEELILQQLTFAASGTGDDALDISNAAIRLYIDDNRDGGFDGGDDLLGTATIGGDNGTATFAGLSLRLAPGADERLIALLDFSGEGSESDNYRITATGAVVSGTRSGMSAIVLGMPIAGPLLTIAPPSVTFLAAGPETIGSSVYGTSAFILLQNLLVEVGSADAVKLSHLEFDLITAPVLPGVTMLSPSDFTSGSLKLVVDVNRDGLYSTSSDADVATGGWFDGNTVRFDASNYILPAGSRSYLMLVGQLVTPLDGNYVAARARTDGALFHSATQDRAVTPAGLPQSSAPRRLVPTTDRAPLPIVEDFEGVLSSYVPTLEWRRVVDEDHSLEGEAYLSALLGDVSPNNSDYAAIMLPGTNAGASSGAERLTAWVRYSLPSGFDARFQFTSNGGSSWSTLDTISGSSSGWVFYEEPMTTSASGASDLRLRLLLNGSSQAIRTGYFDIDHIVLQPPSPYVTIHNLGPVTAGLTTVQPGGTYPITFQVRNRVAAPLTIESIDFRMHTPDGTNRTRHFTTNEVSGDFALAASATNTFTYDVIADSSVPLGPVRIDLTVTFRDAGGRLFIEDSAKRSSPLTLQVTVPTTAFIAR